MNDETRTKCTLLRQLAEDQNLDGILLSNVANIAWLTGGNRTYIEVASERGIASALITRDTAHLITNSIEGERLRAEEGFDGWDIRIEPWYESPQEFERLIQNLRIGCDLPSQSGIDLSKQLVKLRSPLNQWEVQRYRALGKDAGESLTKAARTLKRGMTEDEAAALVAAATYDIGAVPIVVLVASDERFYNIRHALPQPHHPIQNVAMLVVCARRHGLIANLTRIVHFGQIPADLQRRMHSVCDILAEMITVTRPGTHSMSLFKHLEGAYAAAGFPGEWRDHHQGGACSYGSRDWFLYPHTDETVQAPQAFAWNPSVVGAKAEDTVLISDKGPEVLTRSPGWPERHYVIEGRDVFLADILQVDS